MAKALLYACPTCQRTFKTAAEAKSCRKKYADDFKEGDLFKSRLNGRLWRIKFMPDSTSLGVVERVPDYLLAEGYDIHRDYQAKSLALRSHYCAGDIMKVNIDDLKKTLSRRAKQAAAAKRILDYVEARTHGP